ncbi:MAG: HlyD family efflux transporter periplasmic adaptor subunit [Arcobacter sp.]|jgi:adhesin transport system membrane fusion protein|uniref:HlyD family efflux transporter periplasmic adaptor subunit n=1 Tax=Arcobacter sp. TaxID=1872629 RepID=UPI002A760A5B|nr:HlyD family efflux transporter periplasmic adaptor subunit [Arcobacter sp.]MDY3203632.1 HlyD family efflux transporter periplasmic adaptor subunit [Arcobacter sp.]
MSLSIINKQKTKRARYFTYIFIVAFSLLLVWAYNFEIERSIRTQGQIVSADKTQIVQTPESGVIEEIRFKEGDSVKKGDILVVLEKERAKAAYTDTLGKVSALRVTLARLQAEVYGKPLVFSKDLLQYKEFISNQTDLYKRRKQAIDEDIATLNEGLKFANQELELNKNLLKTGDVGKLEILKLQRQIVDMKGQISAKKNKYFQDAQAEMTKVQEDLATQEQTLLDKKQLLEHTTLISPMDGIVNKINFTTIGAVVKPGDEIIELLPTESDLIVEVKIQPTDMSHLVIGLKGIIKLDAYDFSIYGAMIGEVDYISPDALTEQNKNGNAIYYKAKIRIKEKEFRNKFANQIQINPGMTVTVDIKTGSRTVLEYITKPITKTISESLSEK